MKERKRSGGILSSFLARVIAFFLLAISFAASVLGGAATVYLWEHNAFFLEGDAFTNEITQIVRERMSRSIWNEVYYLEGLYAQGELEEMERYLDSKNISVKLYRTEEEGKGELLWCNYTGKKTDYEFTCYTTTYLPVNSTTSEQDENTRPGSGLQGESPSQNGQNRDVGVTSEIPENVDEVAAGDASEIPENAGNADAASETEEGLAEGEADQSGYESVDLTFYLYVDDTFPIQDEYREYYMQVKAVEDYIPVFPAMAAGGIFLFLCSFLFLMCSAGHHRGKEGISGGALSNFHFDLVTLVFGGVAVFGIFLLSEVLNRGTLFDSFLIGAVLVMEVVWFTIYCMEFAVQLKMGTLFKHTLIYTALRTCYRGVKAAWHGAVTLVRGLPLIVGTVLGYFVFCLLELIIFVFCAKAWSVSGDVLVFWFLEKIILFPIILYFALVCKKLQKGSEALSEGDFNHKLDTSKMLLGFKEHGENLNRIGDGIALAVEERMHSEHLKTELITNVSHDIKTPLTSIINYADLIGMAVKEKLPENPDLPDSSADSGEAGDGRNAEGKNIDGKNAEGESVDGGEEENGGNAQLAEYAEVLLRQSRRLKKLLEDLVEASKATTGNLEVELAPCQIGVLLSQAVGEYEQRFAEKQLELIVQQPEEPVIIQADGKHLWRVFDNLMNNICKYAQRNTRVYLTVERTEQEACIIFRNMSEYPLEVSAGELKERFVRGDKSRHMEGNGLGLSIAGSLTELQKGSMELVTDGDLFKVILKFPLL